MLLSSRYYLRSPIIRTTFSVIFIKSIFACAVTDLLALSKQSCEQFGYNRLFKVSSNIYQYDKLLFQDQHIIYLVSK